MKLKLIQTYKKLSNLKDASGMPVVENGVPKRVRKTMFRYGIVGATPEQIALYKRFKNQDGTNYYREEAGVPIYVSSEFLGNEVPLNHYTTAEGKVGFTVDSTEVDSLMAMAEKFPALAGSISLQIQGILMSGNRLVLTGAEEEVEEEENLGE